MKKLLFLLAAGLLTVFSAQAQNRSIEITAYGFSTANYDYRFIFTVNGYMESAGAFTPTSVNPVPKVIRVDRHNLTQSVEIQGAVSNCRAYIIPEESTAGPDREFAFSFNYNLEGFGSAQGFGIIPWRIR